MTPRIVGETSGAVFDAIASSSKSQLPLQAWEHGVFGYICGNNDIVPVPTFPVPVYGLCGESWGRAFMNAAVTNGVDLSVVSGPLLLCPDASGQFTQRRYPSANEVTAWVNGILDRLIPNRLPGFTSQGLKARRMSEHDRHILGGHSMKGRQTAATYARDTLTAPIKGLEGVIASVRHGSFLPDSSRSNMILSSSGKFDARGDDVPVSAEIAVPTSSETGRSTDQAGETNTGAQDVVQDGPVLVEDSSSSSDCSSSDDDIEDEVAEQCMSKSLFQEPLEQFHWRDGCIVYKMNALESCIFSQWALRLGPSFVGGTYRRTIKSSLALSFVMDGSANNVTVADRCMMSDLWLPISIVSRPNVPRIGACAKKSLHSSRLIR